MVDGLDRARGGDRRALRRVFGARRDHEDALALPFPRCGWLASYGGARRWLRVWPRGWRHGASGAPAR
jgi:hypothetical protein